MRAGQNILSNDQAYRLRSKPYKPSSQLARRLLDFPAQPQTRYLTLLICSSMAAGHAHQLITQTIVVSHFMRLMTSWLVAMTSTNRFKLPHSTQSNTQDSRCMTWRTQLAPWCFLFQMTAADHQFRLTLRHHDAWWCSSHRISTRQALARQAEISFQFVIPVIFSRPRGHMSPSATFLTSLYNRVGKGRKSSSANPLSWLWRRRQRAWLRAIPWKFSSGQATICQCSKLQPIQILISNRSVSKSSESQSLHVSLISSGRQTTSRKWTVTFLSSRLMETPTLIGSWISLSWRVEVNGMVAEWIHLLTHRCRTRAWWKERAARSRRVGSNSVYLSKARVRRKSKKLWFRHTARKRAKSSEKSDSWPLGASNRWEIHQTCQ